METGCLLRNESNSHFDNFGDEMMNNREVMIRRPVFQQDDIDRVCNYNSPDKTLSESIKKKYDKFNINIFLKNLFPIFNWLPKYNWKKNLLGDVIAGFTVAIMNIPQGMAYAMLGNVPPIVGLYMAFYPVIVYMIFGTSRHNSMGTFAVVCMMTGKVVLKHNLNVDSHVNSTVDGVIGTSTNHDNSIQIATIVTFGVAIIQLAMYLLQLGVISSLLSDTLVSGFTTAAAVQTYYDVFNAIDDVNVTAMIISSITIVALIFNNEILKPRIGKLCAFPIPIEMIVVLMGIFVSAQMDLSDIYNVKTIGLIPVGLPDPTMPDLSLLPSLIVDCFVITMVSYTISMSMALIFSQKLNYEVDANQELLALGLGNLTGSFFSCMPFTASLSRSLIQQTVGGKTQLASLISCSIILFVLLWIGPCLQPLPRCVLASIIVVALKGMFLQIKDLKKYWRLSTADGCLWLVTFLSVIILDIEYGLLIGAVICFSRLIVLSIKPYTCKLGLVPGTDLYLDTNRYEKTVDVPGIQILHYCGGLNFATKIHFRKSIFKVTGVNPQKQLSRQLKDDTKKIKCDLNNQKYFRVLILDFSALTNIDAAGVSALHCLIDDYMKINISIYLAGCSVAVFETMRKCNATQRNEPFTLFPTVGDAINYAKYENIESVNVPVIVSSTIDTWTSSQDINYNDSNYISRL
ncbi:hypothetical protein HCN44_001289 [Aphidius gifuensis]|uniref:STAS domain-containing protein n=1 Tax=Aphidius gifuensis TaxID=684658 RepID=A0A834XMH5_APHGI|nr:hypothetical protein HCN44_001289 [Aphidius gifuensis]